MTETYLEVTWACMLVSSEVAVTGFVKKNIALRNMACPACVLLRDFVRVTGLRRVPIECPIQVDSWAAVFSPGYIQDPNISWLLAMQLHCSIYFASSKCEVSAFVPSLVLLFELAVV